MNAVLRPATTADVAALVELRALMFTDMGVDAEGQDWQALARDWFLRAVGDPSVCLVVVEDGDAVVSSGMAEVRSGAPGPTCPTGRTAYLSNLVTRREARGRGHAGRCLAHLLEWAAGHADRVELHASEDGMAMYRRLGFAETANPAMRLTVRRAD
ncbi:MAG: GNAT family N-acetyltransferase [Nocardioides sp.]|nr:GNAT family N-acetyltransferase [Nocardioides sp.]